MRVEILQLFAPEEPIVVESPAQCGILFGISCEVLGDVTDTEVSRQCAETVVPELITRTGTDRITTVDVLQLVLEVREATRAVPLLGKEASIPVGGVQDLFGLYRSILLRLELTGDLVFSPAPFQNRFEQIVLGFGIGVPGGDRDTGVKTICPVGAQIPQSQIVLPGLAIPARSIVSSPPPSTRNS